MRYGVVAKIFLFVIFSILAVVIVAELTDNRITQVILILAAAAAIPAVVWAASWLISKQPTQPRDYLRQGLSEAYVRQLAKRLPDHPRPINVEALVNGQPVDIAIGITRGGPPQQSAIAGVLDDDARDVVVVIGGSGYGKTTLVHEWVASISSGTGSSWVGESLPVVIPANLLDFKKSSLARALVNYLHLAYPTIQRRILKNLASDGFFIPVLDAVDELENDALRMLTARIDEYTASVPRARVVIVGQDALSDFLPDRPDRLLIELLPLSPDRVSDFIALDLQLAKNDDAGRRRLHSVLAAPGVMDVVNTPLHAAMLSDYLRETPQNQDSSLIDLDPTSVERKLLQHQIDRGLQQVRRVGLSAEESLRWLTFVAHYLESRATTTLRWWELGDVHLHPRNALLGGVCAVTGLIGIIVFYLWAGAGVVLRLGDSDAFEAAKRRRGGSNMDVEDPLLSLFDEALEPFLGLVEAFPIAFVGTALAGFVVAVAYALMTGGINNNPPQQFAIWKANYLSRYVRILKRNLSPRGPVTQGTLAIGLVFSVDFVISERIVWPELASMENVIVAIFATLRLIVVVLLGWAWASLVIYAAISVAVLMLSAVGVALGAEFALTERTPRGSFLSDLQWATLLPVTVAVIGFVGGTVGWGVLSQDEQWLNHALVTGFLGLSMGAVVSTTHAASPVSLMMLLLLRRSGCTPGPRQFFEFAAVAERARLFRASGPELLFSHVLLQRHLAEVELDGCVCQTCRPLRRKPTRRHGRAVGEKVLDNGGVGA